MASALAVAVLTSAGDVLMSAAAALALVAISCPLDTLTPLGSPMIVLALCTMGFLLGALADGGPWTGTPASFDL